MLCGRSTSARSPPIALRALCAMILRQIALPAAPPTPLRLRPQPFAEFHAPLFRSTSACRRSPGATSAHPLRTRGSPHSRPPTAAAPVGLRCPPPATGCRRPPPPPPAVYRRLQSTAARRLPTPRPTLLISAACSLQSAAVRPLRSAAAVRSPLSAATRRRCRPPPAATAAPSLWPDIDEIGLALAEYWPRTGQVLPYWAPLWPRTGLILAGEWPTSSLEQHRPQTEGGVLPMTDFCWPAEYWPVRLCSRCAGLEPAELCLIVA